MFYLFRIYFDSILNHHQLKTDKSRKKYPSAKISHLVSLFIKKKYKNKIMFSKTKTIKFIQSLIDNVRMRYSFFLLRIGFIVLIGNASRIIDCVIVLADVIIETLSINSSTLHSRKCAPTRFELSCYLIRVNVGLFDQRSKDHILNI